MRSTTLVLASLLLFAADSARADERSPLRHVRSTQHHIEQLLDEGTRRSPTFAALRAALESADVIVYVHAIGGLPAALDGRVTFLRAGNGKRYLRVDVRQTLGRTEMLSIIAHELQHAVEIAGATEVRDSASMAGFYRRVGIAGATATGFETRAAQQIAVRVRAELRGV